MTFKVKPCSRQNIRKLAHKVRQVLKISNNRFPIVKILDLLAEIDERFKYEILDDGEFDKDVHAYWNSLTGTMSIRESVYNGACAEQGRDRMTLAHELGHYLLHSDQTPKMCRTVTSGEIKPYESSEWQAKTFAAELLLPADKLTGEEPICKVAAAFGVSEDAARVQLSILKKERRQK